MLYVLQFFTTWSCIFAIMHTYMHSWIDLKFLTFVVMIVGLYFSFINPRKFVLNLSAHETIVFTGMQKFIVVDMIFHIGVFLYISQLYAKQPFDHGRFFMACLFLLLYISIVNTRRVYGISFEEILYVFIVACIVFFISYPFLYS